MNDPLPIDSAEIDALLDQYRPDRYDAADHGWRTPVVAIVAQRMPALQAQRIAAEQLVAAREGRATVAVNKMLRKVAVEQQWPIPDLTADLNRKPLSIGGERVCLEASTAGDLENWAIDERRDAAQDFAARSGACDGAEWIAKTMRSKGWHVFGDGA